MALEAVYASICCISLMGVTILAGLGLVLLTVYGVTLLVGVAVGYLDELAGSEHRCSGSLNSRCRGRRRSRRRSTTSGTRGS
jgi:hypothetical protein